MENQNLTRKILIIDDDEQLRSFLEILLSKKGYEVITADNGVKGCALFEEMNPDLVITDIVMPEKEGVDVILTVREKNQQVPVIAISGGSIGFAESYLKMAKKLGATEILSKPFKNSELVEMVQGFIG